MSRKYRITMLIISLVLIGIIGRYFTGNFEFLLDDYWFISGILLVILLSLIDQPFFSTEANVFINSVTAFLSLVLIAKSDRSYTWSFFLLFALILLVSSYILMWVRKNPLNREPKIVKITYKILSRLGRPEVLFSLLFIWGLIKRFGSDSIETNSFLLFWGIYIVLNMPTIAKTISESTILKDTFSEEIGFVTGMINPSVFKLKLKSDTEFEVGEILGLFFKGQKLAIGVLIDIRRISGKRIARLSICETESYYHMIAKENADSILVHKMDMIDPNSDKGIPLSIVDRNTKLGTLSFFINPNQKLVEGEIVWVKIDDTAQGFYQVISATLIRDSEDQQNNLVSIHVLAGQLGKWNHKSCQFEPINWVPKAGSVIYKATDKTIQKPSIPEGQLPVGKVPNSTFPIHINVEDTVTHNTAIIGVTGSGKSYLSFHIIEELVKNKIKILILDLSRQHWIYLDKHNKLTAIRNDEEIKNWYNDDESFIGIYQFASETSSYPKATANFVDKVFQLVSKVKLKAGENESAKVCIVFEEAHSLIPEWNQVSQSSDTHQVNRTARTILQGRKYGMGCLIITQRTANVTKTILNQCNTVFALKSFDQTGLDFIANYMGREYSDTITTLPKQHSILVGKASSSSHPILFEILNLEKRYGNEDET